MGKRQESPLYVLQRRQQVAEASLRGENDAKKLAVRFGVSVATMYADLKAAAARWKQLSKGSAEEKLQRKIQQEEYAARESSNSWEVSKKGKVEITTVYVDEKCGECDGTGMDGERWCSTCDGEGMVTVEKVTRRVTGSPGDVVFLKTYMDAVKEGAKFEGVYPEKADVNLNLSQTNVSGNVNITNREFDQAHGDAIIGMLAAADRMRESSGKPAIDVDSQEVEDSENGED